MLKITLVGFIDFLFSSAPITYIINSMRLHCNYIFLNIISHADASFVHVAINRKYHVAIGSLTLFIWCMPFTIKYALFQEPYDFSQERFKFFTYTIGKIYVK